MAFPSTWRSIGRSWLLAILFVSLTLPLGIFLACNVPLGHVADEPQHLLRADGLLYGGVIGHRELVAQPDGQQKVGNGMRIDPALLAVVTLPIRPVDPAPLAMTAAMMQRARAVGWNAAPAFADLAAIAGYPPLFYLPAAAALGTARLVGLPPFQAFILARLANLFCFTAMGAAALLLARRGRTLMACTLAVPMTLNLAASANQDGLLIGAAVLAAALATRLPCQAAPRQFFLSSSYWGMAALIAGIALAKPPYLPLAALLLLPLPAPRQWRTAWPQLAGRLAVVALVALPAFGWTWLTVHAAFVPRSLPPYEAGPLWPGPRPAVFDHTDMAAQLRVLLASPMRFIGLPLSTLLHDPDIARQMIGVLGWLNVVLPHWIYLLWAGALVAAFARDCFQANHTMAPRSRWLEPLLLIGAAVLALLVIYISQYLVWTPVGMPWVGGPQGRYMLPLIPLLAIAVPRFAAPGTRRLRSLLLVPLLAAALADVAMLPRVIISFYYVG